MPVGGPNLFGLHQYDNKTSFFNSEAIFAQGVGYAIICVYGAIFASLTIFTTIIDSYVVGTKYDSEEFNTAGRSIKTGLIAVDVVSHWTWVAVFLQTTTETHYYGISGAFWFAASSCVQLLLFGKVATEIKRRAPKAHTVLELVRHRWGHITSFVFFYICILNNVVVCTLALIGAGNVFVAATGMNIYASLMLLSFSVVVYTATGGLKATFISSYLHTIIIFIALNFFLFKVYASSKEPIGSISKVWDNLAKYAKAVPVDGNKGGSYLTLMSKGGIEFGILNGLSTFGNLWADQSYWQSAIAATPKAAMEGYMLAALLYIPIPLAIGLSLGLATLALDLPLTGGEVNQGLAAVAASQFLYGRGGIVVLLTIVFMAVTSTVSGEFIGMSSLFTYDIYKAYIRPKVTSAELIFVSRASVFIIGIAMGAFSCFIYKVNIDVNFMFLIIGTLVGSSFPPLTFMLTWPRVSSKAAMASALGGQACGITAWLVHTKVVYGHLSVADTLQKLGPTLDGTVVSLSMSAAICIIWTIFFPDTTDRYSRFKEIGVLDDAQITSDASTSMATKRYTRICTIVAITLTIFLVVVWPLLTLPAGVFPKTYFGFWVVLVLVWAIIGTIVCIFLPWWESRHVILHVLRQIFCFKSNIKM